jgi:putative phage-type endonuclease
MQEQNWHDWRKKGIGASDSPIIMGVSPWKTPYQLWLEKTGQVESDKIGNWATQRGHKLEPIARAQYELETGMNSPAVLVEYTDFPFIRASLDGYDKKNNVVLEIKCPGAADHEKALNGEIPEKYYPQLQHQLMVTGAKCVHYYSFDGNKGALIEVLPDIKYCKKLLKELIKFWDCVVQMTPPELTERDYVNLKDKELITASDEWIELTNQIKELQAKKESVEELIKSKLPEDKLIKINNLRIQKITRKGNVDYAKIPELKAIDLEKYRKAPSQYYQFKGV